MPFVFRVRPVALSVATLVAFAAPPPDSLHATPSAPITPERIFVGALAVASSIGLAKVLSWAWTEVFRPRADDFVLSAVVRKRGDHERYLRSELFRDDILEREEVAQMSREALRLAQSCDGQLTAIREGQVETHDKLAEIPRLTKTLEQFSGTMGEVGRSLQEMNKEQGRMSGMLEQMNRDRDREWDGDERRTHPPRRASDALTASDGITPEDKT